MASPHPSSRLPPDSLAWLTWGLLASLYFVGYFQRVASAVMVDELMRDFSITATMLGNLSALYFHTYAAMQIPSGVLAGVPLSEAVASVGWRAAMLPSFGWRSVQWGPCCSWR